jgi:hypothetical protein
MSNVPDRADHPGRRYQQLPLYMTAGDLHSPAINKGDQNFGESHDDLMKMKLDNARTSTLHHDIKNHGIQEPVTVDWETNTLINGHHRVAAANDINPNTIVPIRAIDDKGYWD